MVAPIAAAGPAAYVLSVNVVRELVPDRLGDLDRTAIDKGPVAAPVDVEALGLVGDVVMDRKHHGGRDQAVYAYAREDQAWWEKELGRAIPAGSFGENLTMLGLDVTGAVIGERWSVRGADGSRDVLLEVTAPRIPCATFQGWMDEPQWVRRFTEHRAPGAYLRVLQEGRIAAAAPVAVVGRPSHGVRIVDVFPMRLAEPDALRRLLADGVDLHPPLVAAAERELRGVATRLA